MNQQSNSALPYVIAGVAALMIWIGVNEYREVKDSLSETQTKVNDFADESSLMVQAIRKTINDLREKIGLLEVQYQTLETQMMQQSQQSQQSQKPKSLPKVQRIVMHTADWCSACQTWKQQHKSEWEANGFVVETTTENPGNRPLPWFDIYDGDKPKRTIEGVLPWTTYRELP